MRAWPTLPMAILLAATPAMAANDDAAMLELADKSRCTACHDVHDKVTGPAWIDVAKRYRGDAGALERLVVKVRDGGSGAWGTVPMSPNKRVPEENIRKLVSWILSLK
ncbi:c-type cytochrome [Magnetospirillum gryphiswaldense]|uniref:Cytochrome c, class I n=2 Tax=Magnetospirillum gryphiswaldense TaxID=55518 RepID=A4TY20_9PROT|nr:c-type cytochrome [Magnetospirillum gryphiswaldense]AVM76127.1 Cytochrome c-551 precursor [Magnetospirillum gryphiswaldense MSR-1]AVM80030.1 Cytochrome c-551 precursor [Magnetospirillum gryphiswaldense]CAM75527.1 Cytochrome c, class I [Magnetospirillum gryphiswaldense MSR-1]